MVNSARSSRSIISADTNSVLSIECPLELLFKEVLDGYLRLADMLPSHFIEPFAPKGDARKAEAPYLLNFLLIAEGPYWKEDSI